MWNWGQKPGDFSDVTLFYLKQYNIWNQKNALNAVLEVIEYCSLINISGKHIS